MRRSVWDRLGLGATDEQPSSVNRQLSDAEKNAAEMRRPAPVDTSPPQRTRGAWTTAVACSSRWT